MFLLVYRRIIAKEITQFFRKFHLLLQNISKYVIKIWFLILITSIAT